MDIKPDEMDLAAYLHVRKHTHARVVTVAIDNIVFHRPVFTGDCLVCYASTERIGTTSITVRIEVDVERKENGVQERVTEGRFTFVSIGVDRRPVPLVNS